MRLGIISALSEEQEGLIEAMQAPYKQSYGMRDYMEGKLWGIDAVCVLSRIGKVAAAITATTLVEKFKVTHIVFTGVAGSADEIVRIGDIVVAKALIQHDLDASPLFPRFEVPLTGQAYFEADENLSQRLVLAAQSFLDHEFALSISQAEAGEFGLSLPQVQRGLIGSGDQFIHNRARLSELKKALPDLLCVEMEGAAVAQVCFELGIPCAVMRTISDSANEEAAVDFLRFVKTIASRYAFYVIKRLCQDLPKNH